VGKSLLRTASEVQVNGVGRDIRAIHSLAVNFSWRFVLEHFASLLALEM
jgi:hypothetical protein